MDNLNLDLVPELSHQLIVALALAFGYPVLVVSALEAARVNRASRPHMADMLRQSAHFLLPGAAAWMILSELVGLPPESWLVRMAVTVVALTGLYLLLQVAQATLMAAIDDQAPAPKLLFDIVRIAAALVWGAVIVSRTWEVDLERLFAAMGVGSIVLGFALQEFLGNLLSGLGLLSAHKFGIGDWIRIEGVPARVVEMDWRTVTLVKAGGERSVVANSTLAKGNLTIAARAAERATVMIPLTFGLDIPPEGVRDAVAEAGRAMPAVAAAAEPICYVTALTASAITYAVLLPVADPGSALAPTDEFLSRFWYVAQRNGLRLSTAASAEAMAAPGAEARYRMLAGMGAFHGDADALALASEASAFRRYRRGDRVAEPGHVLNDAMMVMSGSLAMSVQHADRDIRIELIGKHRLLVLQEILNGLPVPVRIVAETDTDVIAIPVRALAKIMEQSDLIARDIGALAETRRLAMQPAIKRLRAVV